MRMALYGSMLAGLTGVALALAASPAQAEEEFDVKVSGTTVKVVAKGAWHVNKEYPWKVKAGEDTVADKAKFAFTETEATVSAPAGATVLKGGVCSGDKCKSFEVKLGKK